MSDPLTYTMGEAILHRQTQPPREEVVTRKRKKSTHFTYTEQQRRDVLTTAYLDGEGVRAASRKHRVPEQSIYTMVRWFEKRDPAFFQAILDARGKNKRGSGQVLRGTTMTAELQRNVRRLQDENKKLKAMLDLYVEKHGTDILLTQVV